MDRIPERHLLSDDHDWWQPDYLEIAYFGRPEDRAAQCRLEARVTTGRVRDRYMGARAALHRRQVVPVLRCG